MTETLSTVGLTSVSCPPFDPRRTAMLRLTGANFSKLLGQPGPGPVGGECAV